MLYLTIAIVSLLDYLDITVKQMKELINPVLTSNEDKESLLIKVEFRLSSFINIILPISVDLFLYSPALF